MRNIYGKSIHSTPLMDGVFLATILDITRTIFYFVQHFTYTKVTPIFCSKFIKLHNINSLFIINSVSIHAL